MANIYETLLNADITSATDTNNINTNNNVAKVYDGDTTYQNGVGYRALGIDTPEMNTDTKVDTLASAREKKLDRLKPTAGELAKLEAELNPLNYLPSGTNAGTDKYGRVLNQNEAYKNDMIHRGYAVPTFFSDENDISSVESMNRAKEAKRGLWSDPEYASEMAGIVDKRILNSTGASNEVKNAAGYVTHQGNTTVDDYMDYAKVKDDSNWIDALQAQASRVLSIPEYLVAQSERVFSPETAQDSINRVAYQMENADILAGYNADEASLPNKLGRAAMSGSMHVANKVAGLAGEGIESLGGAFHGIKNLDKEFVAKENARLAKYGEEVSDVRANILDTLQVGEAGDWLKELGKGIQKDTVEFTKKNNSSKLVGFDTKDVNELQTEVMDTIDKEGYMAAFGKAVTDERSLQVLAQSVPEMIALAFSVGGMALVNVNNNINIAEDNAGRSLTPNEKVLSATTSVVSTYLDRLGDKLALSGMNPAKEALKVAIDSAPAVVKRELGKEYGQAILKIGEAPLRLAGAAAVEGATEYAQTLGEEAAQNVDVFKNGFTDEQLREAQVAGVLGAAMGAQIATPAVGKDVLSSGGTLVADSVAKSKEALQTKKEDISVAPTTADKVNIAKAFASGNDTTGILGSDRTALEKAIAVRDMVSTLVESGALTDENTAVIANKVAEAMPEADVANLIATGKDLGELKKSALAVSKEVSEGPKGFLTYYNKAVESKDPKDIESNVTKLEGFMQKQQEKLRAFYSEEAKVLSEYQSEAEIKGITLEELYERVKNKNTKANYTYGDNGKAWLKKEAVLEKHLSGDGEFNGSSYRYINMLSKEVEAMNRLHSSLVNDVAPIVMQEPAVVTEPEVTAPVETVVKETPVVELSPSVTAVLDAKMARGDAVEDIVDSINSTKATELQKAMAVNYVKEAVTTPKKTENKAEEPKSLMDALIDLKDDAPDRVNSVREALQLDTERTTLAQQIRVANAAGDKEQVKQLNVRMSEINDALDKVGNKVIAEFGQKKVRGAGLSNRFANSVFEPKALTGLSIAGEIDATREVAKVKKVLKPKDAKGVTDAPATSFIYDENGEINPRVAIALAAAASNYVVELEETLMRMDMEEFQSRFTASDVNDINIVTEWRDMATPLRFEAEKIGAEVLSTLGLAVNKTTSLTYEQGLKADLGSVVLAMLRDSGAVKIGKIGNIHAVSVGPRIDTEISKITAKGYEDKYGVAMYKGRTYSTTAPVGEREVGVHRQELMESTPEQAEMIRKQEAMSYSINGGMSVLKEVYGTKEELKKALGKGTRYKSKYMKDAQKSKDREIDISVDSLYELDEVKDANGNSANVWFKWFLSKNGRFGLDSTTVNPQSDKLHRFLVTAESAKATISEEDIADINEEISSNDKSLGFKYAVVQAFDGIDGIPAIDKSSRKKVEEAANEILKMSDEELLGLIKTLVDKKKGHIGHAAAAVDSIRKLKVGTPFVSTLTVEFDGLTNGFAFKMLQSPLGDFYRWLARVGVIGKGYKAYNDVKSIAELKANGMLDTYEVLGSLVKFPDAVETPKVAELVAIKGLPDVTNKSEIRKLMKAPVMVFNYGAGLPSIKKAITKELLIHAIEAIAANPKLKSKYGLKDVDLAKTPITDASLVPLVRVLSTEIETAYATPIAEALKKEFKDTIEYNTTVNNVFGILYNDFVDRYSAKVKGLNRGVTMPSKEENLKITQEILKEYGPVIDGPTTQGLLDRILISQRGATDVESLLGDSAITTVPSAADFGGDLSTVSIIVRGVGDPGASGGVIPTHTADGTVQGKTMKDSDGGYLGVHDAMVLGLDQLSSAKDYNRHWYEVNKNYSIVSSIVKATESIATLNGKEQAMVAKLKSFEDIIQANRGILFGSDMKVGQMVGLPGSMYEVNVKKEPGIIVPKFKTLKDMKDRTEDVRLKNILTDMLKKKKSVREAIDMIDTKVYEGRQLDWLGNADIVQLANEFREVESDGDIVQGNVRTDIMKDTTLNSRATGVLIKDVKDCRI